MESSPSSRPADPRSEGTVVQGVAPLFEPHVDRNALDRMLLAFAVHPEGAGFARAHLLLWNARTASLEGRLSWSRSGALRPLGESLDQARRQATEGTDPQATRALRALALGEEDLEGALAEAWAQGVATGLAAGSPRHPWADGLPLGAAMVSCDGRPYALVVGEWSHDEAGRVALLASFRRTAGHALEAAAAAERTRRSAHQAEAVADLARAAVSPRNLAEILNLIARLAGQGTAARGSAVWLNDAEGAPALECTHGASGSRDRIGKGLQGLAVAACEKGRPLALDHVIDDFRLAPEIAAQLSAVAALPIAAYGRTLGALAVYDRAAFHPSERNAFDAADVSFLATLADLGALAVAQARGATEVKREAQRREELESRLGKSERLATLGEMAARAAREIRNPIASIGAFARRVHRALADDDPHKEYLEVVIREAGRVDQLLAEQGELAATEPPRFAVESLNGVVQEVLQQSGETLVRRRIRLLKKLSPEVPALLLDAERIRRVIENVLTDALETVAPGGRIRVETRRVQQHVVLDVANDGTRPPGELLEQLFVPFATRVTGGGHVGLAVAQEVVRRHGGEIRVRSEAEWTTIFSLTLPIRDNEDRRRVRTDRRHVRGDRRATSVATR